MKKIIVFLLFLFPIYSFAQFTDDFTDGDFTNNPTWTGNSGSFIVNGSFQLQSADLIASSTFYLSTPSTLTTSAQWEFNVNLTFNTSSTNYVDVFLIASTDVLTASLNGYYVRIGGTNDEICLYRKDGAASSIIIDGIDGVTNTSANNLKIKVTRSATNLFTLERDLSGTGASYTTEGSFTDATYTTSNFFGVLVKQSTASFFQKHFFDNFYVGNIILDVTPPEVVSASVVSPTQVDVLFSENVEQTSAETISNYSVDNSLGNPSSATRDVSDNKLVHLTFATSFTSAVNYTVTVTSVEDLVANAISTNNTATFAYYAPPVFKDIVISEIFADPSPQIGLPNFEFIELYNKKLNPVTLNSFTIKHGTTVRTIPNTTIPANAYVILTAPTGVTDLTPYGTVLGVPSLSTTALTNTGTSLELRDATNTLIDSIFYSDAWYRDAVKDDGGYSLELINPNAPLACPDANNWIASNNLNGGTPGTQNSVYNTSPDVTAPTVASVSYLSANQIGVCFSESLDASVITTLTNYQLSNGLGNPTSVSVNTTLSCVTLTFASNLVNTTNYVLSYTNLQDCSGNLLSTVSSNFTYYIPVQFDVLINEIMADPTPLVGLPDQEYLELYNKSSFAISIQNWTITHGTTVRTIPTATIPSNGYLVLVNTSGVTDLSSFTSNVLGVPSLSSSAFTNGGTTLYLKDNNGNLIHSVTYSDAWYANTTKAEGGWSLEMIDPLNPCSGSDNWIASTATLGGTPGAVNSVKANNPDVAGPKLLTARIVNDNTLSVTFSETVIGTALSLNNTYSITSIGNPTAVSVSVDGLKAELTLPTSFTTNLIYTLAVNGVINDCVGNALSTSSSIQFAKYAAKEFDVIINEIMPDPEPAKALPVSEYFELYNKSDFPINVYKWNFIYGSSSKEMPDAIIPAKGYMAFTSASNKSLWKTYQNIAFVSDLSTSDLTNTGTSLSLTDSINTAIHFVNYKDSWYQDAGKVDGGWSLEMIDFNNPCGTNSNWSASGDGNGGTPGKVNYNYFSSPDTKSPQLNNVCVTDAKQIELTFSEPIDKALATTNFSVDNGMGIPVSWSFSNTNRNAVLLNFSSEFLAGTIYSVSITSTIKDCVGNSLSTGSIKFSIDEAKPYDVVINELMPDPEPVISLATAEYIELYNRTNKPVSLSGWKLSAGSTIRDFPCNTIQPNEYVILCDDADEQTFSEYGKVIAFESFPSLSNEGSTVSIRNKSGDIVNAVSYQLSWYGNNNKDDGGWSLERIDVENPCGESNNWLASNDTSGGTPGKVNSIAKSNPDSAKPEVWRASIIDSKKVRVYFNEAMKKESLNDLSIYSIDNGIGSPTAISFLEPFNSAIILTFANALQAGIIYNVSIKTTATDCVGNTIVTESSSARVAIPQAVAKGDILINELMYYPKDSATDYVELYNNSEKIIDLKELYICDFDSVAGQLGELKLIDSVGFLIFPKDYVVLSTSQQEVKSVFNTSNPKGFLDVASLPSWSSSEGEVILATRTLEVIDEMRYYADMQFPLLNDTRNVALERIDFNRPATDLSNWHSAAERVGFGTPAYINSQFMVANTDNSPFTLTPEVFTPDNDGDKDFILISYKLDQPGFVANVNIFDAKGRLLRKLVQNELLGIDGVFTWDGIDDNNQKGTIGIHIIQIELFDTAGAVKKYKLACVLGGKI